MEIIWKEINGYEGFYEVSNDGRVRSVDRIITSKNGIEAKRKSKYLRSAISNRGYCRVVLTNTISKRNIHVHRLVALAFIENPNNYDQVNHKDGCKGNNHVSNLEWCNQTYNNRHARAMMLNVAKRGNQNHSYGFNNKQSHILKNIETDELKPLVEVAKEYPQWTRRHITMMVRGERGNKTKYILCNNQSARL